MVQFSRRQLLAAIGTIPAGQMVSSSPRFQSTQGTGSGSDINQEAFAPNIPRNPDNIFFGSDHSLAGKIGEDIQPGVLPDASFDTLKEDLLRLDPDIQWPTFPGWTHRPHGPPNHTPAVLLFDKKYEIPMTLGTHPRIFPDYYNKVFYSSLPEEEKWTYPDGSTVEDSGAIVRKDFFGNSQTSSGGITPSSFADGLYDRLQRKARLSFQSGATQFWIDALGYRRPPNLDFSVWAKEAFKDHLDSLSAERLDELGITDIANFDIQNYISNQGISPSDTSTPAEDPVFREYVLFQCNWYKEFINSVFTDAQDVLPPEVEEAGTTVYGNQFGLQPHMLRTPAIYLSDVVNDIQIEYQYVFTPRSQQPAQSALVRSFRCRGQPA